MKYAELEKYLDNGGDPNAYNENGWSMLFNYITRLDCFELLLERGANPNQSYLKNVDIFPLFHSISYYHIEHIKLLLKFGADPNCTNVDYNPLHRITNYYLTNFINNNLINNNNFIEIFNLLIKYGADINIKTKHGDSCIDLVVKHPNLRLLQQSFIDTKFNLFMKHNCALKYHPTLKQIPNVLKYWCRRKWMIIRSAVKLLSLHQRAVITANHPNRLKEIGIFEINV